MNPRHAEVVVFFGGTGDLACRKIFRSLQTMVRRGNLNMP